MVQMPPRTPWQKSEDERDERALRSGTGNAAAFGDAKPAVRKRRLAGTDGRAIGAAIDLSSLGPAKNADGESKGVKLLGNGPRPLLSHPFIPALAGFLS